MRKDRKIGQDEQPIVDMENYFQKDKRHKRIEDKKLKKLLKEIHEAEDYIDDTYDEDVEMFKRGHHRDDD